MKKIFILFFFIIISYNSFNLKAVDLTMKSKSSCLIELETGKILYERNKDIELPPASMTKIMTMAIVLDEIKEGNLKWDDIVITSKDAASMGGSNIFLKENEKMSVTDMFKSVAIASANDCAYALGEKICGTIDLFVNRMNEYVDKLNLKHTKFVNATGLPAESHYSSSYDMAMMSRYLLLNHEKEITRFTSIYQDYVREDTKSPFWLVNTNKVLKKDDQVDGLKTGWTEEAGYCITLTKRADGMRLIAVVMGYQNPDDRNKECYELLTYGFNTYKAYNIFEKKVIEEVNDLKYFPRKFNVITKKELKVINNQKVDNNDIEYKSNYDYTKIDEESVGNLEVYYKGFKYQDIDLCLDQKVKKANYFQILIEVFKTIIS